MRAAPHLEKLKEESHHTVRTTLRAQSMVAQLTRSSYYSANEHRGPSDNTEHILGVCLEVKPYILSIDAAKRFGHKMPVLEPCQIGAIRFSFQSHVGPYHMKTGRNKVLPKLMLHSREQVTNDHICNLCPEVRPYRSHDCQKEDKLYGPQQTANHCPIAPLMNRPKEDSKLGWDRLASSATMSQPSQLLPVFFAATKLRVDWRSSLGVASKGIVPAAVPV